MPKKYERSDGKTIYPNADPYRRWNGCPLTCPDSCPYEECTMPPDIAARTQFPVWHGWIVNEDGFVVKEGKLFGKGLKT